MNATPPGEPPAAMRGVLRNALAGFGGRFATLAVGMLMAPYLLARLGTERYAIWALVSVVTSSLALFDLSVRVPLIKFLAEQDETEHSTIASSGAAFFALAAVVEGLLFASVSPVVAGWLAVPPVLQREATLAFGLAVAGLVAGTALSAFPAVCDARHRMDVTNAMGVAALLIGAVLTVALVEAGFGVGGVAAAQLVAISTFHLGAIVAARRIAPSVRFTMGLISRHWLSRLLRFGLHVHTGTGCAVVAREFDKLLLSRWSGLAFTAAYELGTKLVSGGATLVSALSAALLPAASRLATDEHREPLTTLYQVSFRALCLLSVPVFAFTMTHAHALVQVWTGAAIPWASGTVAILAVGYLSVALGSGMVRIAQGIGHEHLQTEQALVQLVGNVVFSVLLLLAVGPWGAPLGTSLALTAATVVLMLRLHRLLGLSTASLLRSSCGGAVACSGIAALLTWSVAPALDAPGRAVGLPLVVHAVLFFVAYGTTCVLTGTVRLEEIAATRRALTLTGAAHETEAR